MEKIYNLKLHQEQKITERLFVRRVPGGWVYTEYDWDETTGNATAIGTTFVPYAEEFIEKPESDTNSDVGSFHWFHTKAAEIKHTGEFMRDKTTDPEYVKERGARVYSLIVDLINGFEFINK